MCSALRSIAMARIRELSKLERRTERTNQLKKIKSGTGAMTHQGGDPTPPGLVRRDCQVPPFASGIPGATKNWVGCTRAPKDQGRVSKSVVKITTTLRSTGVKFALSRKSIHPDDVLGPLVPTIASRKNKTI